MPAPGGRRELDQVIGEIAGTPLDRRHPLWEFHFAEGMADHRFALIGKVHHALADGIASANLLNRVMDLDGPVQDERDMQASCVPPSKRELLWAAARDHVQQIVALPGVIADAISGLRRLWRGPGSVARIRTWPGCCGPRRHLSTTWSRRSGRSRPRRCRWRR